MPKVKDIMTKTVLTVESNKTIAEAATIMTEKDVSGLIIMDQNTPIGIVTERDLVRRVLAKDRPSTTKISEVMSTPLRVIDPEASLKEAAIKMTRKRIRKLPVIKDNKLVGIITSTDFARHLSKKTLTDGILEAIGRSNYPVPDVFEK